MKNTKNDKKFSFLEEYKKQQKEYQNSLKNPLIQVLINTYKLHIDLLNDNYKEELNKNKILHKEITDLINFIYDYTFITNHNKFEELTNKYKNDFDNCYKFTK